MLVYQRVSHQKAITKYPHLFSHEARSSLVGNIGSESHLGTMEKPTVFMVDFRYFAVFEW
jgi:hypothetical protein